MRRHGCVGPDSSASAPPRTGVGPICAGLTSGPDLRIGLAANDEAVMVWCSLRRLSTPSAPLFNAVPEFLQHRHAVKIYGIYPALGAVQSCQGCDRSRSRIFGQRESAIQIPGYRDIDLLNAPSADCDSMIVESVLSVFCYGHKDEVPAHDHARDNRRFDNRRPGGRWR